ncbi:unnamed protein product [Enterobius vermicularis]|uniref:Transmembrane protein n=1 Tax=Enterobius vermicularis TaxID=51028 RepID=A0A0N4VI16_ENTVE|nr:unnamed protein product [Enterobius vermicularis]
MITVTTIHLWTIMDSNGKRVVSGKKRCIRVDEGWSDGVREVGGGYLLCVIVRTSKAAKRDWMLLLAIVVAATAFRGEVDVLIENY